MPAVVEFMEELALQPRRQHTFRRSPDAYVGDSALTVSEREAVTSGEVGPVRALLAEHSPVKEASGGIIFVVALFAPDEDEDDR
jgi:hypothetical protein